MAGLTRAPQASGFRTSKDFTSCGHLATRSHHTAKLCAFLVCSCAYWEISDDFFRILDMPGQLSRRLDQNVDIEFTLRKVFGKTSFRSVICVPCRSHSHHSTDSVSAPSSAKSLSPPLKAAMSSSKPPLRLARVYVSNFPPSSM